MRNELIKFSRPVSMISAASVVGKYEKDGPFGDIFDEYDPEERFGMESWETAEAEMQKRALTIALAKGDLKENNMDAVFAGDLINQCSSSAYGLIGFDIPYFGLYGACSTCALSMLTASFAINAGLKRIGCVTSSHFCSAERQFRFPLEYGCQRTPTSQHTVTGAGAFILSSEGNGPYIVDGMGGISTDMGINDANNMGAAMAPAAISTLTRYFEATGTKPQDYDKIITGDLGFEGHGIVIDLMLEKGYDMREVYTDCGLFVYDREKQDMHAGGSGCGCSAIMMASHFLPEVKKGMLEDILFIGTGALMSPMMLQQGYSIPGIAHLVHLKSEI